MAYGAEEADCDINSNVSCASVSGKVGADSNKKDVTLTYHQEKNVYLLSSEGALDNGQINISSEQIVLKAVGSVVYQKHNLLVGEGGFRIDFKNSLLYMNESACPNTLCRIQFNADNTTNTSILNFTGGYNGDAAPNRVGYAYRGKLQFIKGSAEINFNDGANMQGDIGFKSNPDASKKTTANANVNFNNSALDGDIVDMNTDGAGSRPDQAINVTFSGNSSKGYAMQGGIMNAMGNGKSDGSSGLHVTFSNGAIGDMRNSVTYKDGSGSVSNTGGDYKGINLAGNGLTDGVGQSVNVSATTITLQTGSKVYADLTQGFYGKNGTGSNQAVVGINRIDSTLNIQSGSEFEGKLLIRAGKFTMNLDGRNSLLKGDIDIKDIKVNSDLKGKPSVFLNLSNGAIHSGSITQNSEQTTTATTLTLNSGALQDGNITNQKGTMTITSHNATINGDINNSGGTTTITANATTIKGSITSASNLTLNL
ncbi:hypothetical protein, partial [Helicobacter sp. 11S02596-1]|uniref:hypothetical protein n=1 Tax=Helicobacter sp. 11S02596-1 TaxID=1476194 RepID=UPI00117ABC7C